MDTGARSIISCVSPRCEGTILCRFTLLELVDNEPALDEWLERLCSRCADTFASYASSNLSACLDPLKYEGTKNDWPSCRSPPPPGYPNWVVYEGRAPLFHDVDMLLKLGPSASAVLEWCLEWLVNGLWDCGRDGEVLFAKPGCEYAPERGAGRAKGA